LHFFNKNLQSAAFHRTTPDLKEDEVVHIPTNRQDRANLPVPDRRVSPTLFAVTAVVSLVGEQAVEEAATSSGAEVPMPHPEPIPDGIVLQA